MVLIGTSVVVVAESNNPTILNPDFLTRYVLPGPEGPVSQAAPPICTPVLARVVYDNGVEVRSEPHRVVFEQGVPAGNLSRTYTAQLARAYIQAVPHVRYTAIGVNPSFLLDEEDSYSRFQHHLSSALPMGHGRVVPTVDLKAIYSLPDRRVSVESFAARPTDDGAGGHPRLLLRSNVHHDIVGSDPDDRVLAMKKILDRADSDISGVETLLGTVSPFAASFRNDDA